MLQTSTCARCIRNFMDSDAPSTSSKKKWVAYAGIGAFTFFLVKGLAWLIVPAVLIWWGAH